MLFQANLYQDPYMMNDASAGAAAGVGGMMMFVYMAFLVLYIVGLIKVFQKAGRAWWEAIIPFYNTYVLLLIVKRPVWWLLVLFFVPLVNLIFAIILMFDLAKAFGKGALYGLGLVFFGPIFLILLGFGSAQYQLGGTATAAMPASPTPQAPQAPAEPVMPTTDGMTQPQA